MIAKVLFDTNILVYAAIGTGKDDQKRRRALQLIESEEFGTSAQVIQEFFVTVTRKAAVPMLIQHAAEWIDHFTVFPCQPIDYRLVTVAIDISKRYQISYWDAAILAAAAALRAEKMYSEDLNDGQIYAGIEIVNPFRR